MISGLSLRYWAAETLGEFYTRTLRIIEGHQIVAQGPHRIIRNPGYLGILMLNAGAGLAVMNWIVLLASTLVGFVSFGYRIRVEEAMLETSFGEQYKLYLNRT